MLHFVDACKQVTTHSPVSKHTNSKTKKGSRSQEEEEANNEDAAKKDTEET